MADLCSVCNKNEVSINCEECGTPLCGICAKEVMFQEMTPASMVKPGISMSPTRAGMTKKKVCPKCMKEVDLM
ncbi:MAG: hypothetical protein V3U31_07945 [Dehalococcoidia bacterium]